MPIISNGIIAFRKHQETKAIEYLMICRKDTLGLMDFIRGKYSVNNKYYIMNMISQMTVDEKHMLLTESFDTIWRHVWHKNLEKMSLSKEQPNTFTKYGLPPGLDISASHLGGWGSTAKHENAELEDLPCHRFKSEEHISRDKFNQLRKGIYTNNKYHSGDLTTSPNYTLTTLINECSNSWDEPEWGFPKGRRNYNENDIECALREFYEETGFKNRNMGFVVSNLAPYEEVFMGSNYKSYKHRYYLMYVDYNMSLNEEMVDSDKTEISKIEWKSFNDCLTSIRPYNLEKKRVLSNVNIVLKTCTNTLA